MDITESTEKTTMIKLSEKDIREAIVLYVNTNIQLNKPVEPNQITFSGVEESFGFGGALGSKIIIKELVKS